MQSDLGRAMWDTAEPFIIEAGMISKKLVLIDPS